MMKIADIYIDITVCHIQKINTHWLNKISQHYLLNPPGFNDITIDILKI